MKNLLSQVTIQVNENIYLKDPESSSLGKKIITGSINLIDQIGFEDFTFRKLAKEIGSTEASVYRYFESKHKLLLYLFVWYWGWMEYRMVFALANISSARKRLDNAIKLLTSPVEEDLTFAHINEVKLNRIIISESSKTYLNKDVDEVNKQGVFLGYKQLVALVSDIVLEINPEYKYSHMLISSLIEGAHQQRFFARHLPRLTDSISGEDSVSNFYREMVFKTIDKQNLPNNHE